MIISSDRVRGALWTFPVSDSPSAVGLGTKLKAVSFGRTL